MWVKDSLLRYTPDGKWAGAVPFNCTRDSSFWGVDYKKIRFLIDPSTNSCYLLEKRADGWAINRLNQNTGQLGKRIPLPNYPGMSHINVFKNAIYFLYDQKNFPYYVRLYRYPL